MFLTLSLGAETVVKVMGDEVTLGLAVISLPCSRLPQGLPFCIIGAGDLLALFRCISCKYKYSTDTTKPWLMGPGTLWAIVFSLWRLCCALCPDTPLVLNPPNIHPIRHVSCSWQSVH